MCCPGSGSSLEGIARVLLHLPACPACPPLGPALLSPPPSSLPPPAQLWDVREGGGERALALDGAGHRSDVRALALSSDDALALSGSSAGVKVWNPRTGACLRSVEGCGYVLCALFAPGNRHAVVGTKEGGIAVVDVATAAVVASVPAHSGAVWSLAALPDGSGFVSGSADHDVKFWEWGLTAPDPGAAAPAPRQLGIAHTRTLQMTDDVLCVRLSPDGRLLAVALLDSTVRVFFADSLKFFLSLYGHKLPVLAMDISSGARGRRGGGGGGGGALGGWASRWGSVTEAQQQPAAGWELRLWWGPPTDTSPPPPSPPSPSLPPSPRHTHRLHAAGDGVSGQEHEGLGPRLWRLPPLPLCARRLRHGRRLCAKHALRLHRRWVGGCLLSLFVGWSVCRLRLAPRPKSRKSGSGAQRQLLRRPSRPLRAPAQACSTLPAPPAPHPARQGPCGQVLGRRQV